MQAAANQAAELARAHRALVSDGTIQTELSLAKPAAKPPGWLQDFVDWLGERLKPVGRALGWVFEKVGAMLPDLPYARIFFWTVIGMFAAACAWAAYNRIRHGEWRLPRIRRRRRMTETDLQNGAEETPLIDEAEARSLLAEAERAADDGRFAEAIHGLLLWSIDAIARRRPYLIRPALTSRELSRTDLLPGPVRELFASIAERVELSLFGGHAVSQADWVEARAAYADLVLPRSWRS